MRRLSLLLVVSLVCLGGVAAAAHASAFAWHSADAGASIRQASIDTDGDGLTDDQDKCPTQAGFAPAAKGGPTPDGCPLPPDQRDSVRARYDQQVQQGRKGLFGPVFTQCSDPNAGYDGVEPCKAQGKVTLSVSAATRRMMRLSSAVLAEDEISRHLGGGVIGASLAPKPSVKKKFEAWVRKATHNDARPLKPFPAKLTFEMTFPQKVTLTTKVEMESNKTLVFLFGAGYPAEGSRQLFCGAHLCKS